MGDRANFGFVDSKGDVLFLYGHWAGHNMLAKLANAVQAAERRWDCEDYATRICVSRLIGDDWESNESWGLYVNQMGETEHKVPIINWSKQTFTLMEEDLETVVFSLSLAAFVDKYSRLVIV